MVFPPGMVSIIFEASAVQVKSTEGHDIVFDQQSSGAAVDATTGPTVLDPLPGRGSGPFMFEYSAEVAHLDSAAAYE